MEIPVIYVQCQSAPFFAALCPEFGVRLLVNGKESDLQYLILEKVSKEIACRYIFYVSHQSEIRANLEDYKRVKKLYRMKGDLAEQLYYKNCPDASIADKFGFKV